MRETRINWKEQFKIRLKSGGNASPSQLKHEVVKLVLMHCILKQHSKRGVNIAYSEFNIGNGKVVDIYHQKKDMAIGYEVQEKVSKRWLEDTIKKFQLSDVHLVVIPLKKISNNLQTMEKQIMEYVI